MKHCEKCTKVIFESEGNLTLEELEDLGKSESADWCNVCKQFLVAHAQARNPSELITLTPSDD